ncbi:MAG: hypothetical protein SGI71_01755 [Verrucomicrobiota bacterium]|nr:hypothetical protein [Verrucomicrobiota bacterium]
MKCEHQIIIQNSLVNVFAQVSHVDRWIVDRSPIISASYIEVNSKHHIVHVRSPFPGSGGISVPISWIVLQRADFVKREVTTQYLAPHRLEGITSVWSFQETALGVQVIVKHRSIGMPNLTRKIALKGWKKYFFDPTFRRLLGGFKHHLESSHE